MKRIFFLMTAAIALLSFSSCKSKNQTENISQNSKKLIVCTIFPQYDWCREILGSKADSFNLVLLLDKGTDLHSFQPTFADIAKVSSSDLFVYIGGESDNWVSDALKEAKNKNLAALNLMETLGNDVKEEELVEGMQGESKEDDETEYDEHIWLSLKNAKKLTSALCAEIQKLDPQNANLYAENAKNYIAKLDLLDKNYEEAVSSSAEKTILVADRFPFRYLADDYGLKYYAAFLGCSAESEASFETIIFLAKKVDELSLGAVLTIENSDKKIARTIVENSKSKSAKILELDSLQSVTGKDIKNGKTYLSTMEENLKVLKDALSSPVS